MEKGKKVCNELKAIRQRIADANGIEYTPNVCNHEGECAGTCPACEEEVKYLEKQLNIRSMLGKAAVVAGLGIVVSSCFGGFGKKGSMAKPGPDRGRVPAVEVDTVYELEGDVPMVIKESDSDSTPDSCSIRSDAKSK